MKIQIHTSAVAALDALPKRHKEQILHKLHLLAKHRLEFPPTKKLHPPLQGFRLRVGSYRVIFAVQKDIIYVEHIGHRKDMYR